jgi:HTH-type transcriptional repressor of NAD biosynthesis genes
MAQNVCHTVDEARGVDSVKRGLAIGKFYPPHRGHKFLIETALRHVDHLDVLVCVRADQTISGDLREQWLREIHPSAHVLAIDDIGHDDDSEVWAKYTLRILGQPPDIVFTSEDYGESYARCLGCTHFPVDRERQRVPVSGTQIRSDPFSNWEFLEPCVRAYFAQRICIVGAESTGTTTLAQDLADHYRTVWVPEYGREYCEQLVFSAVDLWNYKWKSSEFLHIAREQRKREDEAARQANRILICDTDALATGIWHERYLGTRSPEVAELARKAKYALYILTDCDIPFVQDGLRDGESIRQWMTRRFEEELAAQRVPWMKLSGSREHRLQRASQKIGELLSNAVKPPR